MSSSTSTTESGPINLTPYQLLFYPDEVENKGSVSTGRPKAINRRLCPAVDKTLSALMGTGSAAQEIGKEALLPLNSSFNLSYLQKRDEISGKLKLASETIKNRKVDSLVPFKKDANANNHSNSKINSYERGKMITSIGTARMFAASFEMVGEAISTGISAICHMDDESLRECQAVSTGISYMVRKTKENIPQKVKLQYHSFVADCQSSRQRSSAIMSQQNNIPKELFEQYFKDIDTISLGLIPAPALGAVSKPIVSLISKVNKSVQSTIKSVTNIKGWNLCKNLDFYDLVPDTLILPHEIPPLLRNSKPSVPSKVSSSLTALSKPDPYKISAQSLAAPNLSLTEKKAMDSALKSIISTDFNRALRNDVARVARLKSIPTFTKSSGFPEHLNQFRSNSLQHEFAVSKLGSSGKGRIRGALSYKEFDDSVLFLLSPNRSVASTYVTYVERAEFYISEVINFAKERGLSKAYIAWNPEKMPVASIIEQKGIKISGVNTLSPGINAKPYLSVELVIPKK